MVNFNDLSLELKQETRDVKFGDMILSIVQYLPVGEKTKFIQYVVSSCIDDTTGCASPLRVEVYFALAVCRWYADIGFEEGFDPGEVYDLLDSNGIVAKIMENIPSEELGFIQELVTDTIQDIVRYNNSAVGLIQAMNANAAGLDTEITDILNKIKNGEGLETLSAIKDVVGTD